MYSRMSWEATFGPMPARSPAGTGAVHPPEAGFVGKHDPQPPTAPLHRPPCPLHSTRETIFLKGVLRRNVLLRMERTRHQLAPAMPTE
jgi:hypothetical protein